MLELEVQPGKALGAFALGMTLSETVSYLHRNSRLIPRVEILYDEQHPLERDTLLDLVENGIILRFDSQWQRLRLVEVYEVGRVRMSYLGAVFCAPDVAPSFALVYSRFGPSYPGEVDAARGAYFLNYPGVSFVFAIRPELAPLYEGGTELPLEFPDGSSPQVQRVYIFAGASLRAAHMPADPNSAYGEPVVVRVPLPQPPQQQQQPPPPRQAPALYFERRQAVLELGVSPQEVLSLLGPPQRVHTKQDDKMRIHLAAPAPPSQLSPPLPPTGAGEYFYNYFDLGLDLLFSLQEGHAEGGQGHVLRKIVLHSNQVCSSEFNHYRRCFWRLELPPAAGGGGAGPRRLDVSTRFDELQAVLGEPPAKPLIYSRASAPHAPQHPFGHSLFYAYPHGLVFEVLRNQHIASLTLFRP